MFKLIVPRRQAMNTARIWRHLDRPEMGIANSISRMIRAAEWRNPDLLTSVRVGPKVVVALDFGGEHKGAAYETLSVLVADAIFLWLWEEMRLQLRQSVLGSKRTMSFKKLGDRIRTKAFVPFLTAANAIPGVLFTFAFHKRIGTLFRVDDAECATIPPVVERAHWKRDPFEKLCRAAHLSGLVLGGLCQQGQDVLWVTDEDEILPNDERHREGCDLIAHILSHYSHHNMGRLLTATTKSDDGSRGLEDLVSITDLAAGCMSELTTCLRIGESIPVHVLHSVDQDISRKARAILGWMSEVRHPLKKLLVIIDHIPPEGMKAKLVQMVPPEPIEEYDWYPVFAERVSRSLIVPRFRRE